MQPRHEISADRWPDHVQLSDIERRFVCKVCSKRGAEVRPDFRRRMGTDAYISFDPFPVRRDVCLRSGRPPDLFNHLFILANRPAKSRAFAFQPAAVAARERLA